MKKNIKNVIMITIILVVCVLSYLTASVAMKRSMPDGNRFEGNQGRERPNFNNGEIPERPSKNFNEENQGERPEIPEGKFENGEVPDINNLPEDMREKFKQDGSNPKNFDRNFKKDDFKPNIGAIYYILFIVEGLTISILVTYLIMSKFNSKTLKEVLQDNKKIIIFITIVIILTIALTVLQSILAKSVFKVDNVPQFENMKMPNTFNNSNVVNEENNNI